MKAIKLFDMIGNLMLSEARSFEVKIEQENGELLDAEAIVDKKEKIIIIKNCRRNS